MNNLPVVEGWNYKRHKIFLENNSKRIRDAALSMFFYLFTFAA